MKILIEICSTPFPVHLLHCSLQTCCLNVLFLFDVFPPSFELSFQIEECSNFHKMTLLTFHLDRYIQISRQPLLFLCVFLSCMFHQMTRILHVITHHQHYNDAPAHLESVCVGSILIPLINIVQNCCRFWRDCLDPWNTTSHRSDWVCRSN